MPLSKVRFSLHLLSKKLAVTQQHYVEICHFQLHPYRSRNMGNTGRSAFTACERHDWHWSDFKKVRLFFLQLFVKKKTNDIKIRQVTHSLTGHSRTGDRADVVSIKALCFYSVKSTFKFYVSVSVHHKSILYKEPTRCNFGSIVY